LSDSCLFTTLHQSKSGSARARVGPPSLVVLSQQQCHSSWWITPSTPEFCYFPLNLKLFSPYYSSLPKHYWCDPKQRWCHMKKAWKSGAWWQRHITWKYCAQKNKRFTFFPPPFKKLFFCSSQFHQFFTLDFFVSRQKRIVTKGAF
jgi:hypothetical protein